ncbi:MAG: DUF5615 family PIN-like protein, partial [Bacteroidota bacterium]|nr:DUF5615 family PIN-like protein [Bacteroidota bacterium]
TSVHINQILQKWHTSDAEICRYADTNSLVVVTKDSDFKNSHFINKTPKKIIRVVLGNTTNIDLILLFTKYLPVILPLSINNGFYIEIDSKQIIVSD